MIATFNLDPDFRKDAPTKGDYCCRCQKPLKGRKHAVTVDWDTYRVAEGHDVAIGGRVENCWIGPDCLEVVKNS